MKIKSIDIYSQRNEEHLGFMSETLGIFKKYTPAAIDVPTPFFIRFNKAVEGEDVSYKIVVKSAYTLELSKRDAIADSALGGFSTNFRAFLTHYDPIFQAAAYRIKVDYDAFGDIRKKSYVAQATDTINLLQVLNGKLADDIALLNLDGWVTRIEETHNSFMEVYNERHDEKAEKDALARLRDCRIETDEAYRAIIDRVNAGIIFNGEDKYKQFVIDINVSIDYYNNIMATRRGRAAAEKEKKNNPPKTTTSED